LERSKKAHVDKGEVVHAPSPSQQELIYAHWKNDVQAVWSEAGKHMFDKGEAGPRRARRNRS